MVAEPSRVPAHVGAAAEESPTAGKALVELGGVLIRLVVACAARGHESIFDEGAARHGFLTPRRGLRPRTKKEIDNDVRSIKSKEGVKSEVGREIRPARCACRR